MCPELIRNGSMTLMKLKFTRPVDIKKSVCFSSSEDELYRNIICKYLTHMLMGLGERDKRF